MLGNGLSGVLVDRRVGAARDVLLKDVVAVKTLAALVTFVWSKRQIESISQIDEIHLAEKKQAKANYRTFVLVASIRTYFMA